MLGFTLAVLSVATSAFAVVLVGKNSRKSTAFNVSLVISCVGMAVLWPLAVLLTDFATANLEGFALFAVGGILAPGIVRLCYYEGLKKLGASCDWQRTRFTMEPSLSRAVIYVFVDLYRKGKIYRGLRMTN